MKANDRFDFLLWIEDYTTNILHILNCLFFLKVFFLDGNSNTNIYSEFTNFCWSSKRHSCLCWHGGKTQYLKETGSDIMGIIWYCLFSLRQNWANIQIDVRFTVVFSQLSSWQRAWRGAETMAVTRQNFNEYGTCRDVVNKNMEKHLRQNRTLQCAAPCYSAEGLFKRSMYICGWKANTRNWR